MENEAHGGIYRQLTHAMLVEHAKKYRDRAVACEAMADLIKNRDKVWPDGREDIEPLLWAFFCEVLR